MELMGYELTPDYYATAGGFLLNSDIDNDSYISADESARLAANTAPAMRFHYRSLAFDLAKRSADNLPPRSQAFAAVMCTSLRWAVTAVNSGRATLLYQRYVREGAHVGWSARFGDRCEAPDFSRASALVWQMRAHSVRVALRPYKIPLVVLAIAVLVGLTLVATRRLQARRI